MKPAHPSHRQLVKLLKQELKLSTTERYETLAKKLIDIISGK